ncbi:hypothetical protein OR263_00695 [Streptomyces sp. NEAU-H22]|uniref:DUF6542 domain-containing protein n=1 Tax=unclassified Streptomyces TaxID=2593676 RepID=UPI00224CD2D3|nr:MULTISPECIES: DUF6542 domain-containing protein [unclassified Streptomyces]MCX3285252.1 hypothetical protein [Streptomyces sp. NEAU-H22]WMD03909.1 hypothetical protein Q7C01_05680 [Streptomyces sp. FXY-T5]
MEQYRTRSPQYGPRRDRPRPPRQPVPSQAGRGAGGEPVRSARPPGPRRRPPVPVRRPAPAPAPASGGLPNPRLTGLGSGLFCAVVMFLLGALCSALFGSSLTAYGVLFLPVSVLTALWVRRGDLMTAPVVVPIAFAVGLLPVADGEGGTGTLMGLVTALATQAGWLYGGTLIAGLIVIVRRIRLVHRRRTAGSRPPV